MRGTALALTAAVGIHRRHEAGFTLIELLVVTTIIGVLAIISGNRMMRARMSAEEASAVAALRNINSSQQIYANSCAAGAFALDLQDLSTPPAGSTEAFISPDLSANGVRKGGYTFTLTRGGLPATTDSTLPTCNGARVTPASDYFASADPVGFAGARYFATDKRGTVYEGATGPVPNPIPDAATVFR